MDMNKSIATGSQQHMAKKNNMSLAETFLSAEMVIILDNSGSMTMRDTPQRISRVDLAQQHLETLQAKYPGKVALICFADNVEYSPGGMIIPVGGGTDLGKALRFSKVADDCGLKIVIISDGEPNDKQDALNVAKIYKSRIDVIYCGSETSQSGMRFLQELANISGGQLYTSDNPGELLASAEILMIGG